jgi:hypothetical protein
MLSDFWSELRFRARALFARTSMENELDAELRFHTDREVDKYVAGGMDRAEAKRRATLAFGGLDRIKDDTRDARGVVFLERLQRTSELGIRVALGAGGDVLRLVVREAMRVTLVGVGLGLLIAWAAARPLKPLLYKISEHDPIVFVGVAGVLAAVAILASAFPAARASRVDPNVALRAE